MITVQYDKIWKEKWGDNQRYGPVHRHNRRLMEKILSGFYFDSIMDIGCGEGTNLLHLSKLFPSIKRISGVDISSEALQMTRRILPSAQLVNVDIQESAPNFEADLVLCCNVLEHLPNDTVALENTRRVTQKFLLVSTVLGNSLPEYEKKIGHVRNYKKGELEHKLINANFEIVSRIIWGFPFYSPLLRFVFSKRSALQVTFGKYGFWKRIICDILYWLFMLNSHTRGDHIMVLAKPKMSSVSPDS